MVLLWYSGSRGVRKFGDAGGVEDEGFDCVSSG